MVTKLGSQQLKEQSNVFLVMGAPILIGAQTSSRGTNIKQFIIFKKQTKFL